MLCGLLLTILSCEKDANPIDSDSNSISTVNVELDKAFKNITNNDVGYIQDGKVELGVSDEKILSVFKDFIEESNLEFETKSFEVITIDDKNYLRFYGKNNMASTIALVKGDNDILKTGKTVCTSDYCASCCGCVPDGLYCTECPGDCKRTTTGGDPNDPIDP